ncbi:hypothetical protein [Pontibacter brevis]
MQRAKLFVPLQPASEGSNGEKRQKINFFFFIASREKVLTFASASREREASGTVLEIKRRSLKKREENFGA